MVGQNIQEHPSAVHFDIVSPTSEQLDLRDSIATLRYMREVNPDIVIHAAGRVGGIQANTLYPIDFLIDNFDLGRNVIMAAYKSGVPKLINLASSCMYPFDAEMPLTESLILKGALEPTNEGYALAKIFATRLCEYINRESQKNSQSKFKYKTLIPCNLFGRFDNFDPQNSHLIPAIIHKVHQAKIRNLKEVTIWGDGTAKREFMYAADLADAIMKCLHEFDLTPDLMNIGMGFDHTISDYYQITAGLIGWHGRFIYDNTKPIGMRQKLVDITLQQNWGWTPTTSIKSGIQKAYMYYLERQNL